MLIGDRRLAEPPVLAGIALAAAEVGPVLLQVREKDLDVRDLLEQVAAVRRELRTSSSGTGGVSLLVNGRVDVAMAAGADGVHLTASGPPVERVRQALGDRLTVGVSTHSPREIREARAGGADYVLYGPIHDTPSKRGLGTPQGLAGLREALEAAGGLPLLALGGIDLPRARECRRRGAHGVGLIRAVLADGDPPSKARHFQEALREGEP